MPLRMSKDSGDENRPARPGSQRPRGEKPRTIPTVWLVVGLLLLVGYVAARPMLEKRLGISLPPIAGSARDATGDHDSSSDPTRRLPKQNSSDSKTQPAPRESNESQPPSSRSTTTFALIPLSGNRFQSPAGLIYGPSRNEHRMDHVMRHAVDDPDRPQSHGVFDAKNQEAVFALIDDAYELVKQNSRDVTTETEDGRKIHTVDFHRRVGYLGGQTGKRRGHPECQSLVLVLSGNSVITAYPVE